MLASWENLVGNEHRRHVPLGNAEISPTDGKLLCSFTVYIPFLWKWLFWLLIQKILQICSLVAPELRITSSNT